jgi:hypothetical protein
MNGYNQSLISAASCLFRFDKLRQRGHKTTSRNKITSTGHGIHGFAVKYHYHCWKAKTPTDITAWREIAEQVLIGSGLRNEEKDDFLSLAEGYVNAEVVVFPRESVQLEEIIKTQDGRFYGTPDRIVFQPDKKTVAIDDWKSYRRIPPETECRKSIQLPFYAMILADNYPELERFSLRMVFLRYGKDYTWTMTRKEVEEFRKRMEERCAELDAVTEFPAKGGADCVWCEFTDKCPLIAEGEIILLKEQEEAVKAAGRLCALKAKVKNLTEQLKDWVEAHGPVEVPGAILNFNLTRSMVYSVPRVCRAFKKLGVTVEEVLDETSISATAIKRVGKRGKLDKDAVAAILALGEEKPATRFGMKRPDGEGEDE